VVTEGTLGPIYTHLPKQHEMETNFVNLAKLYEQVFKELNKILPQGARMVMCLPAYKISQTDYAFMPNLDFATKNGYTVLEPIPDSLRAKYKFLRVTNRRTIVYDRKDQIVAREILIFHNGIIEQEVRPETVVENAEALETESDEERISI
jgi:tRNA G10  N-methylase Trm11